MNQDEVLKILHQVGAILEGHFLYTSFRHGRAYVNKDAVYAHPGAISRLCHAMAEEFASDGVETVIGPAVGGCILANRVAEHLSALTEREVLAVYADKEPTGFAIRRGYELLVPGTRVLVVDDVLTTGGSAGRVIDAARVIGGDVIGLGVLVNRGRVTIDKVGNPPRLFALANLDLESWDPKECPLCAQGIPIDNSVGKGRSLRDKVQG